MQFAHIPQWAIKARIGMGFPSPKGKPIAPSIKPIRLKLKKVKPA